MNPADITMEPERQDGGADPPAGAMTRHRLHLREALAAIMHLACVLLCVGVVVALLVGARLAVYSYLQWGHPWPDSVAYGVPHDAHSSSRR